MFFGVSIVLYAVIIFFYRHPDQFRKRAFLPNVNSGITADRFIRFLLLAFGILWGIALFVYSFRLIFGPPLK